MPLCTAKAGTMSLCVSKVFIQYLISCTQMVVNGAPVGTIGAPMGKNGASTV